MAKALPLIGLAVVAVLAFFGLQQFASNNAERALEQSAIGSAGSVLMLTDKDVKVAKSNDRIRRDVSDFSLRILPLLDTALEDWSEPDPENPLFETTQRNLTLWAFNEKIERMESLVALPKWTSGMPKQGLAHETFLIDLKTVQALLRQVDLPFLVLDRPKVNLPSEPVQSDFVPATEVAIYKPQLFSLKNLPASCKALVKYLNQALVVECEVPNATEKPVFLLSDPDLLNTHGLSLGQNAGLAHDLIKHLRIDPEKPVYNDLSANVLLFSSDEDGRREKPDRTTNDLMRLFTYPLSAIFALFALIMGAALWRGLVRFGPVATYGNEDTNASKHASVHSSAHLLRLAGHDHHLAQAFVGQRMQALETQYLGKIAASDQFETLLAKLKNKSPDLASAIATAYNNVFALDESTPAGELFSTVEQFETLYQRIANDT